MSYWPSSKAAKVYRALLRRGWTPTGSKGGSHVQMRHPDYPYAYTWAFHDGDDIGPTMLARIAKKTGIQREDL